MPPAADPALRLLGRTCDQKNREFWQSFSQTLTLLKDKSALRFASAEKKCQTTGRVLKNPVLRPVKKGST
ncbi:MAG: hypothetical protein A2038_12350 [Deltaproteobacteria bacterium GWA2_57_13]|nr:MAG: hypothetical protein A2038_12350 [Deltaproteobacteria bacterium GWA2_57_13]OGQ78546.1 MAG: hypothetical protein A3G40_05525 [Deltaproteobacteria bacterium RIFCSPLOWO2_12_FULL_57_22]